MPIKFNKIYNLRWVHITDITDEDIEYLEENFKFHPLDIKDCREGVQRPKLDIYSGYLFMIYHFPIYDERTRRVHVSSLNVFLGIDYLITLTTEPDKSLNDYFARMQKKVKRGFKFDELKNNPAYLLYKIIDMRYRQSFSVINVVAEQLSVVEEEVYSSRNKAATTNLAIIRRNILNLRRLLEPQIKMIDRLVHLKGQLIPDRLSVYYDDVHDYIENTWAAFEGYRDTVDGLYSTNESMINQKTNEVIKTLTLISVALLPMTLVASIYGMNVEGLPFADHPIGLWVVFVLMGCIVLTSIYFARRNNMI
ncbi:MAG: magnesium transporter CorA family protein [Patescibacteria group bacterium]